MPKKLRNVRLLPSGARQAMPRIKGKLVKPKTFPKGTPDSEILAWIEEQQRNHGDHETEGDSLAADVAAYLAKPAVQRKATRAQIATHLGLWLDRLGRDRTSRSVSTSELNDVMHAWLNDGLASETVRKRCTSLQSFFEKHCPTLKNPFHKSDKPKLPKVLEARGVDYVLIERVLATMAALSRCKRNAAALGKIVCRIMAYTGIPPATLNKIAESDLVLLGASPSVRVPARDKGEGVEARTLPLSADALNAFRDFDRANGYGCVSVKSASASWRRACRLLGGAARRVRFYDLRHSYLTETYRVTKDLATVGRLGLHAEGSTMTARYARAANHEVDTAAVNALSAALAARRAAAQASETVVPFASVESA